jgi:hypothetical protein
LLGLSRNYGCFSFKIKNKNKKTGKTLKILKNKNPKKSRVSNLPSSSHLFHKFKTQTQTKRKLSISKNVIQDSSQFKKS